MRKSLPFFGIALVVCFLHAMTVHGQAGGFNDLSFDHLTLEDGLSESTVLAIAQDKDGFIWVGTREGLNRYDARKIKVFRNDPKDTTSISDSFIYSLYCDRRGRFWAGTRNGLNLFDPLTLGFRRFLASAPNASSLPENTVTCILEDHRGRLWFGTRGGLRLLAEGDSLSFLHFTHRPGDGRTLGNDDIHALFEDRQHVLWVGTSQGFSRLDLDHADYNFTSFALPKLQGKSERNNSVNAFGEDDRGRLIVGTERSGLIFVDKETSRFSDLAPGNDRLQSKAARSIFRDPSGNFWIGTIGGLYIASADFSRIQCYRNIPDNPASISDNSVRSLYYDRDGSLWIGTFHGGVNIYSPVAKQFRHLQPEAQGQELHFKIASAITTDKAGNFWIGTEGNGLLFLDPRANIRRHFRHEQGKVNSLCHDNIKCLLLEEGKGIWIGTLNGLDFYDFKRKKFDHFTSRPGANTLPDDVIYDIINDGTGKLWVATYFGGLLRVDERRRVVEQAFTHEQGRENSLTSRSVTRLLVDSKKRLWAGTASGLNQMMPDGTFRHFLAESDSLSQSGLYIVSIFEDSRRRLWIGTRGSGLHLATLDGKPIRHFSQSDGLPGNSIYAVEEDAKGYLWISTENGLSRMDPRSFTFRNYNRSDGLRCMEFNFNSHHRDHAGYFYFGGYNGVAYFHPDSIYENKIPPAIAFTNVRLFNKEITASDGHGVLDRHVSGAYGLTFRYNQNIFSVEFAVLNFINPRKNQYAYRLAGFEEEWNYRSEPIATYMNLAPGTYTLWVKGSNNDGVWVDKPASLTIKVLPPPWKSGWAYAGYVFIFGLLLYIWARLNRKQIRLEHDLRLEHMEKVKQEELHQAKLNFFTNIAHEIRTPVTLMIAPIEHLLASHSHNSGLKKELTLMKNNTDRLMRLLNQLLDFQKQETGNVVLKVRQENIIAFVKDIVDSFQEYARSRKVSLKFRPASVNSDVWFDRDELSKVFFNLLVNALKFTPGGGEVNVSILPTDLFEHGSAFPDGAVKIVIEDNGLGVAAVDLEKIFHRFYQAENTGIQSAGFGIGLALTKGIIDLHNGAISVESQEATSRECGFTRFTIMLPVGSGHFTARQIVAEPTQPEDLMNAAVVLRGVQSTGDTERSLILIVEDNDDIRKYLYRIIKDQYEVIQSTNGADGLAVAQERLPDLIVSDVMMPVMDGIELVRKLKDDQRTDHIPVILLTARGTLNHQVEGFEMGADDYITKPFHSSLLLAKIKTHLAVREKLKEKYSRIVTLEPKHEEVESPDDRFLRKLMAILEENIENHEFNVSRLAKEIGMSRPVLFRKTKMLTGLSVIDLIRDIRLKKAEMLLKQRKLSISEIAFTVGFSDPKYFSKSFRNQYGKPPSQYVEGLDAQEGK